MGRRRGRPWCASQRASGRLGYTGSNQYPLSAFCRDAGTHLVRSATMPRCSSSSITFRRDGDDEIHREPGARGSRRRSSRGSSESELVVRSIAVGGQPAPAQKSRDLALCIRPSPHETVGTSHSVTRPRLNAMDCLPRVEVRSVVAGAPRTLKGASLSGGQHRCRGVGYQPASHSRAPLRSTGRQAPFF